MRFIGLFLVAAILSACAPNTVTGLRQDPGQVAQFRMNENYQSVYRRLATTARSCFETNLVTAQAVVRSELYSDLGAAEVSYELFGVNNEVYAVVDLTKDGTGTLVKITTAKEFESYVNLVEKHLNRTC